MRCVMLSGPTDIDGWRNAARQLLSEGVVPLDIHWSVRNESVLDWGAAVVQGEGGVSQEHVLTVPRSFLSLVESVLLHRHPERFTLLYRLLWRLQTQRQLLECPIDVDVARALAWQRQVHRDMHKMKAFVRFAHRDDEHGARWWAWFEPEHHIVLATAEFFVRRFTTHAWSIVTPEASVHWDGAQLTEGPGGKRPPPHHLEQNDLWLTYYASIFNPARLKVQAMRAEMPKKYWRNLPEARFISGLIGESTQRTRDMLDQGAEPCSD